MRVRKPPLVQFADFIAFCLCLVVLVLVLGYLFGVLPIFREATGVPASLPTVFCLTLLALIVVFRRTEAGALSILLGRGIGSRIARVLCPVLVIVQFLREAGRIRLGQAHLLPPHYATAILAALASMVSLAVVVFLAWSIHGMELKIHELSLRDELTGLYNLRGFSLLAEQALRVAQRSQLPFSVLYVDVDNLKQVNDSQGHEAGSAMLAEMGHLLKNTFRETDVIGRIGGDEFAVAGHFSHVAIAIGVERLRAASAAKNADTVRRFPLNFSVGHVTADDHAHEILKELVSAADQAMYVEKRAKKVGRG
jgi:diguanylate cyclase (GGDEF)-like protein